MNLFLQIFSFIFAASNSLTYDFYYLPTKDNLCQTTGESPELTASHDVGLFDTTGGGHFFTMSNSPTATLAKKSSKSANLSIAATRQQTINNLLNEYFDFTGASVPVDILCHIITTTSTDKSLMPEFKEEVIFEASRLIKLISQLNELRVEDSATFTFKGKEVGHA